MARRRTHHLWLVVLLLAAGIGLAGAAMADGPEIRPSNQQDSVPSVIPTGGHIGVVPARTEAGAGKGTYPISGRNLLPLVATLLALAGVVGLAATRRGAVPGGAQPLLARRHAIALRAPPSPQLV